MANPTEYRGVDNPKQHLIDLGLQKGLLELGEFVLQRAETVDDIGRVLRRSDCDIANNTTLGDTQIITPLMRLLYADDPLVQSDFKKNIKQKYDLPNEAIDAYYTSEQNGYITLQYDFEETVNQFTNDGANEFVNFADTLTFNFLRTYFGFTQPHEPSSEELLRGYAKLVGNRQFVLTTDEATLKKLAGGSSFVDPVEFNIELNYFRKRNFDTTDGDTILNKMKGIGVI